MQDAEYWEIPNWSEFQHYNDRRPPWIKLHFGLLASRDWVVLDNDGRVLAVACMLIASQTPGSTAQLGIFPNDLEYIRRVAYLDKPPDLSSLVSCGFIRPYKRPQADASKMLASASIGSSEKSKTDRKTDRKTDKNSCRAGCPTSWSEVVEYLNQEAGRNFKADGNPSHRKLIETRLKEYTLEDLKKVVDDRCADWKSDERMFKYLRPSTLFSKSKFEEYHGSLGAGPAGGPELAPEDLL